MSTNFILFQLALNIGLMVYAILLTNRLFNSGMIDKATKRSFILMSVVVPVFGFITAFLKFRRSQKFYQHL